MIDRRQFCKTMSAATFGARAVRIFGSTASFAPSPAPLKLILDIPLGHPFFSWPRTLISWNIPIEHFPSGDNFEILCNEIGKTVPLQIASQGNQHREKKVLFFADLPADTPRSFILRSAPHAAFDEPGILIKTEQNRILIDSGPIQIRIPDSQQINGLAPGPILQVCRNGKWTGESALNISGHPVSTIRTELLESGPLRSSHRITYTTRTGFAYIAQVECYAGADYFRIYEDMAALPADAAGEVDFAWIGCDFNWRQAPNHPYDFPRRPLAKYEQYPWERIAPEYIQSQFGVARGLSSEGRFPFSLRTYEPWQDVAAASFANFWSDHSSDAAAIFIDRIDLCEDHEYAIWHSSSKLAVEFAYRERSLHFVWKLSRGTRSACVAFYDHAKDVEAMSRLERDAKGVTTASGNYSAEIFPDSYALNLQNWHSTLSLDKIKEWTLTYPPHKAQPKPLFRNVPWKTVAEFNNELEQAGMMTELALSGVRQNNGFGPTSSRQIYTWLAGFQIYRDQMDSVQRRRITTYLLLLAYVHAGEDYMPMRSMLAGHPNFLADVKSVPAATSFLFPEHQAADTWAEEWEAYLRLNTHYHTRPAVREWCARGGRWTENLGTYVWAFLRPSLWASFLLKCRDGYERMTTPELALLGDWLVNALSAPFAGESAETLKMIAKASAKNEGVRRHHWGVVNPADGPRRTHPPIGAHSERRKPPRAMWYLGTALMNYSPLVAEHLMWAARPTDQDMEQPLDEADPFEVLYSQPDNRGTNPHLRSSKYTGYGITLRASVDTSEEISIHLIQIDDGPNYRWGNGTEGACGVIYFYANGKGYSYNGMEDEGDRIDQNTDFGSNFGVWKNGSFLCIGQNVLARPLYDLGIAQFAELVPRSGADLYSWPEYVSRSVLLAGDEYFILYDRVFDAQVANRFSWFVRKGDDFPHIIFLDKSRGEEGRRFTSLETETTSGKWADGMGDCIALITHKEGIHATPETFGGRVFLPEGTDMVFVAPHPVSVREADCAFSGTSGIIRNRGTEWELVLFHGTSISAAGLTLTTADASLGIAARISNPGEVSGTFFARADSSATVRLDSLTVASVLYMDGARVAEIQAGTTNAIQLPAGSHSWEITASLPTPAAPVVARTESTNGGAIVHGTSVAAASLYELEISADNAVTWKAAGASATPVFSLEGLSNGRKYHVRISARNSARKSSPGPEYPIYVTDQLPHPPDGLTVHLSGGAAVLHWGKVLGIMEYRLYRKQEDESQFQMVYRGLDATWTDPEIPANDAVDPSKPAPIFQYSVTSVSHIGESHRSRVADTRPDSWRNFRPTGDEPFRRTVERTNGPLPNDEVGRYYPEQGRKIEVSGERSR